MPNSIVYEQNDTLRKKLFELFSTGNSPDMAATKLEQLLCCLPLVTVPQGLTYENVFRILIVQFLDPYNFDVRSVKRSCIHIAQPNGHLIPFDTYNIFYRPGAPGQHLVKSAVEQEA
jgi:7,8-dihydro-6-hydroxymethylpterin dimethyltransferase